MDRRRKSGVGIGKGGLLRLKKPATRGAAVAGSSTRGRGMAANRGGSHNGQARGGGGLKKADLAPRDLMEEVCQMVGGSANSRWRHFLISVHDAFEKDQKLLESFVKRRWKAKGILVYDIARFLFVRGFKGIPNPNGTRLNEKDNTEQFEVDLWAAFEAATQDETDHFLAPFLDAINVESSDDEDDDPLVSAQSMSPKELGNQVNDGEDKETRTAVITMAPSPSTLGGGEVDGTPRRDDKSSGATGESVHKAASNDYTDNGDKKPSTPPAPAQCDSPKNIYGDDKAKVKGQPKAIKFNRRFYRSPPPPSSGNGLKNLDSKVTEKEARRKAPTQSSPAPNTLPSPSQPTSDGDECNGSPRGDAKTSRATGKSVSQTASKIYVGMGNKDSGKGITSTPPAHSDPPESEAVSSSKAIGNEEMGLAKAPEQLSMTPPSLSSLCSRILNSKINEAENAGGTEKESAEIKTNPTLAPKDGNSELDTCSRAPVHEKHSAGDDLSSVGKTDLFAQTSLSAKDPPLNAPSDDDSNFEITISEKVGKKRNRLSSSSSSSSEDDEPMPVEVKVLKEGKGNRPPAKKIAMQSVENDNPQPSLGNRSDKPPSPNIIEETEEYVLTADDYYENKPVQDTDQEADNDQLETIETKELPPDGTPGSKIPNLDQEMPVVLLERLQEPPPVENSVKPPAKKSLNVKNTKKGQKVKSVIILGSVKATGRQSGERSVPAKIIRGKPSLELKGKEQTDKAKVPKLNKPEKESPLKGTKLSDDPPKKGTTISLERGDAESSSSSSSDSSDDDVPIQVTIGVYKSKKSNKGEKSKIQILAPPVEPVASTSTGIPSNAKKLVKPEKSKSKKATKSTMESKSSKKSAKPQASNSREGKFKCTEEGCDQSFTRKSSLNRHISEVHGLSNGGVASSERFKCDQPGCSTDFARKSDLKTHFRNIHSSEEQKCELCGKLFKSLRSVKEHQKRSCKKGEKVKKGQKVKKGKKEGKGKDTDKEDREEKKDERESDQDGDNESSD